MTYDPKLLAKVVAAQIMEDSFEKNNEYPIDKHDYKIDLDLLGKAVHIPEDTKEWVLDNKEDFEALVNQAISNHINYIQLEGFGYKRGEYIKLYTPRQITNQLEKILK